MLESSKITMSEADLQELRLAEILARATMRTELEENLMPAATAVETIDGHARSETEAWKRAVYAALVGIRAATRHGYQLSQAPAG